MEINEKEFLKSDTNLASCKEKLAPLEVAAARQGRDPSAPRYLVEAGLEALTAGVALVTSLRARDLVNMFAKDKADENIVKRLETALTTLQKALG